MFGRGRRTAGANWAPGQSAVPETYQKLSTQTSRFIMETAARARMANAETEAVGGVTIYALDREVATLDYGESLAGGRRVVLALTARKVSQQAALNDRRIRTWFG